MTIPPDERDRLERLAPHYDSAADFDRYILEAFAAMLRQRIGGSVLDLGCSSGTTSEAIVGAAASLDLVDGSEHYIAVARERVKGPHVRFFVSLFEDFVPDRPYDHIVCSHVMEHVADPVGALARAKTWLAPGGRIWVYVPNARSIHRMLGVKMGVAESIYALSERDHQIGHRRVYDRDSLSRDIRAAGLDHGPLRGALIKPFPNSVMSGIDAKLVHGLVALGADLPDFASDIYYECYLPVAAGSEDYE